MPSLRDILRGEDIGAFPIAASLKTIIVYPYAVVNPTICIQGLRNAG